MILFTQLTRIDYKPDQSVTQKSEAGDSAYLLSDCGHLTNRLVKMRKAAVNINI